MASEKELEIRATIQNSNLVPLRAFLLQSRSRGEAEIVRLELLKRLGSYPWDEFDRQKDEVDVIYKLRLNDANIVDVEVIAKVLQGLVPPDLLSNQIFALLFFALSDVDFSRTNDVLCTSCVVWINKLLKIKEKVHKFSTPVESLCHRVIAVLNRFTHISNQLEVAFHKITAVQKNKVWDWLISVYLESFMEPELALQTLKPILLSHHDSNSLVLQSYLETIKRIAKAMSTDEMLENLFYNRMYMNYSQVCRMHPLHYTINRELILHVFEGLKQTSKFLHTYSSDPSISTLSLMKHDKNWFHVFTFFRLDAHIFKKQEPETALFTPLDGRTAKSVLILDQMVETLMRKDIPKIHSDQCTIEFLNKSANNFDYYYRSSWGDIGQARIYDVIARKHREAERLLTKLHKIRGVCDVLFKEGPLVSSVQRCCNISHSLTLQQLRAYLSVIDDRDVIQQLGALEITPIARELLDAIEWLSIMCKSDFFLYCFHKCSEKEVDAIVPASLTFQKYYNTIMDKTISFGELWPILPMLESSKERAALVIGGSGFNYDNPSKPSWTISRDINKTTVKSLGTIFTRFKHLDAVNQNQKSVQRVLAVLPIFLSDKGLQGLEVAYKSLQQLMKYFKERDYDSEPLSTLYTEYYQESKNIDSCFFKLSADLFEELPKATELFNWLRKVPSEVEFTSSIEFAMGKSEMECPAVLWDAEPGKPGRVSEEKLSMLAAVRGYLYSLIYRPEMKFDRFKDLIFVLRDLRIADENIIHSLRVSIQHAKALIELLDDNERKAAPERLHRLTLANALWKCSNTFKSGVSEPEIQESVGEIWLEWKEEKSELIKQQNISELMDFQSTLVLGSESGDEAYLPVVDKFVQQFGWMKHLWSSLSQLHIIGHFDFRSFNYEFPITTDENEIRSVAMKTGELLDEWIEVVRLIRTRYYFVNFFSMRHLWLFVAILDGDSTLSEEDIEMEQRNFLSFVNIEEAVNPESLYEFWKRVQKAWNKSSRSAVESLELCAKALEVALSPIGPRCRPLTIDSEHLLALPMLTVICAPSPNHIYDHVISSYARVGYLPEYSETYICNEQTTWEDINMFAQRWMRSHQHNRANRLYCLAAVDQISFELQRKLVALIHDGVNISENPLVIISGKSENQHVITQFAHCRSNLPALPDKILRQISSELSRDYSAGIHVFTGLHAGCGKTFQVRSTANKSYSEYFHFPILSCGNILEELLSFQEVLCSEDYMTLHFDIADNISNEFSNILFNITFLGGIYDTKQGRQYIWNPERTSLAFEMPISVYQTMRLAKLLPQVLCIVDGSTFVSGKQELMDGMGEDFYSSRYDGTALRKPYPGENIKIANAYERLRYISFALQIMDANSGKFPYVDESVGDITLSLSIGTRKSGLVLVNPKQKDIVPAKVYQLVMKASQQDETGPSLWCLWNFINVFYWQLREMHHPESPINVVCMPDQYSEYTDDAEEKAKIKGEVVQFMIRTAREFATRQQVRDDPDRITNCQVSISNPLVCGYWTRLPYDNDKQPCFSKIIAGTVRYLFYRSSSNQWVVSNSISDSGEIIAANKGSDIHSNWFSVGEWEIDTDITITQLHDRRGYESKAIRVEGVKVIDGKEQINGTYLKQPPYDNINGRPHYVFDAGEYRRHLFWCSDDNVWKICPVCNAECGVFIMSSDKSLQSPWKCRTAEVLENATFRLFSGAFLHTTREAITKDFKEKQQKRNIEDYDITNEYVEIESMEDLWDNTIKWNDSNHECLLFSNQFHSVRFLSLDPKQMRDSMHPSLLHYLLKNGINVGEDLNNLSGEFHRILWSVTEVERSVESGKALLDGRYCLTGDSLLKMLAIFARLRCGVPVVLMGECGCGKTMLIKYLCAWMDVKLLILDVHGGTSEADIIAIFDEASTIITLEQRDSVYIFLDEINTCAHMALLNEAICHRSLRGKRITEGIRILAALNPYRKRPEREEVPGLVYKLHGKAESEADPMSQLVYRVHPIPITLRDFIFDYGSLTEGTESAYILSMVESKFPESRTAVQKLISQLIASSQQYIRKIEKDTSSASLRDVRRCLNLVEFFNLKVTKKKQSENSKISAFACSVTLGLAFVYYYRINDASQRKAYWRAIDERSKRVYWDTKNNDIRAEGFHGLKKRGSFEKILVSVQESFCANVRVEDGVAMNQALMENLFVLLICILNKIPVFVVGKPGSSKSLAIQVIASNLQGKQSVNSFWRKFPAVYIIQYQCSPMSDSHSIQHQFDMAVRYQEHSENTITVLLLDEVGLAEHSPEMPLKVLHGMLIDPPVAIVGISNWVLDPAKMNRAICLQRVEPSESDIKVTGQRILASLPGEGKNNIVIIRNFFRFLAPLASAYHSIYSKQKGRDFVGMRDYYNLIKLLRIQMARTQKIRMDPSLLTFALCRNFGGKPELMTTILKTFHRECFKAKFKRKTHPHVVDLVSANLSDPTARHLMLLTKNGSALSLLFGSKLLRTENTLVLIGSEFPDDRNELHLVTQINQVKLAMAKGSTVVLLNHDNIYEALYDVLNQRYLCKTDAVTGKTTKLLRLAIGSRSQLCAVGEGFRIIVIVEQDHAYDHLDLPLLNRFEKQVLYAEHVLSPEQTLACKSIYKWMEGILRETKLSTIQQIFGGFHRGTIPSAVLACVDYGRVERTTMQIEEDLKRTIALMALPIAVTLSPSLRSENARYFEDQNNFESFLDCSIIPQSRDTFTLLLTYSPSHHFNQVLKSTPWDLQTTELCCIQLGEVSSERMMKNRLSSFYRTATEKQRSILVIQCDPLTSPQTLIDHSRHIALQEYSIKQQQDVTDETFKHIIFLIHMPPGLQERKRIFSLDYDEKFQCIFVDDLRVENETLRTVTMLHSSVYELVLQKSLSVSQILRTRFQYVLSCCTPPVIENSSEVFYSERIKNFQRLLEHDEFFALIRELILRILEYHSQPQGRSGMHKHVAMASTDVVGSLRQSLELSMHTMILQALAHCIITLDTNFNLQHALTPDLDLSPLWIQLARSAACFTLDTFVAQAEIGSAAFSVPLREITNTGRQGALACAFPFSHKISKLLNEKKLRNQVQEQSNSNLAEKLHQTCLSLFGEQLMNHMNSFSMSFPCAYLFDYIEMLTSPIPGLTVAEIRLIYLLVIRTALGEADYSLSNIQASLWVNETRIHSYCAISSILAMNSFDVDLFDISPDQSGNISNANERLSTLDISIINRLFHLLWKPFCHEQKLPAWTKVVAAISSDVSFLLSSNSSSSNFVPNLKQWYGIRVASIFLQEVFQQDVSTSPDKLKAMRNLNNACEPFSLSYFRQLIVTASEGLHKAQLAHVGHFVRRYVQEIIFGEQEGFLRIDKQSPISQALVNALQEIVNTPVKQCSEKYVQLQANAIDIPLRRVIIHCLARAYDSNIIPQPISLSSLIGRQLYLQYCEDKLTASNCTEPLGKEDVHLVQRFGEEENPEPADWCCYLMAIARCRYAIQAYTDHIIDVDIAEHGNEILSSLTPLVHELLTTMELPRNFAMKSLRNHGGIDALIDLLEQREYSYWIPCDRDMLSSQPSIPDPFSLINKEEYEKACALVRHICSKVTRAENCSVREAELICASFSEVYLQSKAVPGEQILKGFTSIMPQLQLSGKGQILLNFLLEISHGPLSTCYDANSTTELLLFQLMTHIGALSLELPKHYFTSTLWHPDGLSRYYFPFLTSNPFAEVGLAVGDTLGWYVCPRGHPYTVGECRRPMQQSHCLHPGCGAIIGGKNHIPAKGNKRISSDELDTFAKPGYPLEYTETSGTDCNIIRLFTHLALTMSSFLNMNEIVINSAMSHIKSSTIEQFRATMFQRAKNNLKAVQKALQIGETDACLLLHLILRLFRHQNVPDESSFITKYSSHKRVEQEFSSCIRNFLHSRYDILDSLVGNLQESSRISGARLCLGPLWDLIHESNESSAFHSLMWRYREPVTFQHFIQTFRNERNSNSQYPVLQTFIKEEARLHTIKYIVDILAWHRILFEIFPPNSISRDEAANITNEQAIREHLATERHEEAFDILHRFCIAFNECLPMIELFFECELNPFITNLHGSVDLSGARSPDNGVKMSPSCSINFSLPSMVRGTNDAMGFCTIRLIDVMQNLHEELLHSFSTLVADRDHSKEDLLEEIPPMSYLTDPRVLRQQLIIYERQHDFIPLLQVFAIQSLRHGKGIFLDYDYKAIESSLIHSLLNGKMPVKIQLRHFQFRGDVKNTGHLADLHLRVPQKSLSGYILELIWKEIDTKERLMKIMIQVEMCISFICSIGSSNPSELKGTTLLHDYILHSLLLDPAAWDTITTQTISQHVHLHHLQSLYTALEEKMYGSPLDNVETCYRVPLNETLETKIQKNAKKWDLVCLTSVLRKFLVEQLCEVKWEITAPLKEYLTYVQGSVDLEELDWFENDFPDSIQLKHAYCFYNQISKMM